MSQVAYMSVRKYKSLGFTQLQKKDRYEGLTIKVLPSTRFPENQDLIIHSDEGYMIYFDGAPVEKHVKNNELKKVTHV